MRRMKEEIRSETEIITISDKLIFYHIERSNNQNYS